MTIRHIGKLKNCNSQKRYGFVSAKGYPKGVFVHANYMPEEKPPINEQKIEFSVIETERGAQARDIKVLSTPESRQISNNGRSSAGSSSTIAGRQPGGRGLANAGHTATPYTFVPVEVKKDSEDGYSYPTASVFHAPGHDGTQCSGRVSGKLKLTLTAHTPLLVGGRHFKQPGEDKNIIEPWRLKDQHKRVLLAGSSLKGMIRHHVSALLNAPMEKVYEQYFSYRPNLDLPRQGSRTRLEFREAVIESAPDESGHGMSIRVLGQGRQAIFVRSGALSKLQPIASSAGDKLPAGVAIPQVTYDSDPRRRRLYPNGPGWQTDREYQLIKYNGGIAGIVDAHNHGEFSRLHDDNGGIELYKAVLAPTNGKSTHVEHHIVEAYRKTQQELADTNHGHSSSRNPNIGTDNAKARQAKESLEDAKGLHLLKPDNLIYVEINDAGAIVSFGHHFRYRWGYRDTVRKLNRIDDDAHTRPELAMHYDEGVGVTEDGYSAELTAARAIFGYAADDDLHGKIFTGSFQRLAGRLSFNHAVEVVEKEKDKDADRFVHHSGSPLLPLKELGSPKASAVEFYIRQRREENDNGRLSTYGDLVEHPDAAPQSRDESCLAGRKFYRHQPAAERSSAPYLASTPDEVNNNRASLAHCASQPGTQFRVTLRFQDLNQIELGALLFVLGIQHAKEFRAGKTPSNEAPDNPTYALKLGYARPLGFGSVTFALDGAETIAQEQTNGKTVIHMEQVDDPAQWRQACIQAFLDKVKTESGLSPHLDTCLEAWSYAGRKDAAYPRKDDGEIFDFHTDLRRRHSKARRVAGKAGGPMNETVLADPAYGRRKPGQ